MTSDTMTSVNMTSVNMAIVKLGTLLFIIILLTVSCTGQYVRCGGRLTQKQGVIQSPNFPGPFMTPVFCEWVIQAPPRLKIVLYLTQYYLKGFFHVYEFDHYTNKDEYIGERKLATVNCEDEVWSIVAHKPFMVLRFAVQEMGNIHLRVLDHLIDVYGFNITYEMVNKLEMDSKWTCSAFDCSYLGNCLASSDFSEYTCNCFPEFFGHACQYGPHCNPRIDKNMCQNNGSCRYLYGDYVNICQCVPGYRGSMCEQKINGLHPSACAVLDCEQTCITSDTEHASCGCNSGFRLSSDNRTCTHIDRHKYNIMCALWNRTAFLSLRERESLEDSIIVRLQQRGVFSVENVTISQDAIDDLNIILYVDSFEKQIVDSILTDVILKIKGLDVDMDSVKITSIPELYLLSATMRVDSGTGLAALEDKSMTLSCVARGSPNIVFRWFKDGYLLDLSLFQRRAHETLIPSSRDGILRSVLTFDRVSPLDRGTFTCEARDSGIAQNKSLIVNVITVPLVDLYPLSVSVVEGESMSIICMSPDDTAKNFTYSWHSDGLHIQPGRSDKIVEDLFPTGTRLYVPKVKKSENYSCTVDNRAGVFSLTSYVFMQKASLVNMTCGRSYHKQVLWKKTAGNHFDKERCPSETGDFSVYGPIDVGYATRHCVCLGENCAWAEPNFAKCQSVYLVYEVYDKLEMLRLGYQQTTIKYVYDRLCEFIVKNDNNLYSGDVELAVSILHELLRHLEQFPQLAVKDDKITVTSLVELLDMMIKAANQSTWEEKQDMKAAPYFLRICQIISRSIDKVLLMNPNTEITSSALDVLTYNVQIENHTISTTTSVLDEPLSDSTNLNKLSVISFTNKAIQSMLSAKILDHRINTNNPISSIHSVFPVKGNKTYTKNLMAYIPIKHTIPSTSNKYNQTVCVSWEFDDRISQFGRWTDSQCTAVKSDNSHTVCKCSLPGHFMVISVNTNKTVIPIVIESYPGLPIVIACIINIVILGGAIIIYVIKRRWLIGDEYSIHFSFMLSVLIKSATFLICLRNSNNTVLCSIGRIVVYFCFMAAHSLLFAESMHIFITTGRKHQIRRQWYKYMFIGWGIPSALTTFFGIASRIFQGTDNCRLLCWIERGHWHYFGFIIPIIAFDFAIAIMLIFALRSCIKFQDETRYISKKSFFLSCLKSISILILLNVCSYTSTGIIHDKHIGNIISYSAAIVLMVIIIFMTRCMLDKEIFPILWTWQSTLKDSQPLNSMKRNNSSSFKAYMKPEVVQQSVPEKEGISQHYDRVNRTKFTDEHKRQLSFLLGSSQSGGDLVTQGQDRHSNKSISLCIPSDNGAADSGIFGSESERFLNGFDSSNQMPLFNQTTTVDVHSPGMQNGFIVSEDFGPFPELIQRNACKEIILQTSRSNRIVRTKFTDPKANQVISESGESTAMLLPERKQEDNSDEHESDSL